MSTTDPEAKKARLEAKEKKLINLAKVKAMKTDTDWNVLEQIIQEVMATYTIQNPDKKNISVKGLREDVIAEIKIRFKDDKETRDIVLGAVPSEPTLGKWIKKPKWTEAVWDKVRTEGLFTAERRSEMINALFSRGLTKSDNAAKIWLTLSGDYSDKLDIQGDKAVEKFREINEILHKKNNE